jgi:hypothetical protein
VGADPAPTVLCAAPAFVPTEPFPLLKMRPTWDALYAANVDVVLNGHDHVYERFAPQTPSGVADPARGIREVVVGSGGGVALVLSSGAAEYPERRLGRFTFAQDQRGLEALTTRVGRKVCFREGTP